MGLFKSKSKVPKGEEQEYTGSRAQSKDPVPQWERSTYSMQPRKCVTSTSIRKGSKESRDTKTSLSTDGKHVPQIVITSPSGESLLSYQFSDNEEMKTIRETPEYGIYSRHRNPSTVDAYDLQNLE